MGALKGNNTTQSSSSTAPSAQGQAIYSQILGQAANAAATPYQAYTGQLTAPVNSQQTAGINNVNANAGFATPYVQQAAGLATGAANPLTQGQIQNYLSPYTQDVVNATQAQFNNQNQQQQAALTGNTIAQGALGGNRAGVAQGVLAGQQQLAQAPVIAGLENAGYQNALTTAAQQYQGNPLAAANSIANFGISGQNAALAGANSQLSAGTLEQQTQQAQDTAAYQQFLQQQAYPFQTAQYYANIAAPIAAAEGTTSSGQTTGPAPNSLNTILGGLGAGVGALGATGAFGSSGWLASALPALALNRGGVVHRDSGGGMSSFPYGMSSMPYAGVGGYVPTTQALSIHMANAAPFPQIQQTPQSQSPIAGLSGMSSALKGSSGTFSGPAYGGGNIFTDEWGGSSSNPLPGLDASDYGAGFARGGGIAGVRGYADGGTPDDAGSIEDRFAPVREAIASGDFDPQGANATTFEGTPGMAAANIGAVPLPVARPASAPVADDDDDEAIPAAAQPTAGVAGLARPAIAPAQPFARDDPQGGFAGLGTAPPAASGATNNFWPSLMAAGLGMMASRSPYWGVALGEGGLQGLKTYSDMQASDLKARQDEIKQQQDNRRIEMEAQRLQMAAQQAMREAAAAPITTDGKINPTYLELKRREADINQKDNWTPIGSVVAADGSSHPLVMNRADHTAIDLVTQKPPLATDRIQGVPGKGPDPAVIQHNVDAIASGHQPPTLTGLYGQSAAIRAGLEEKGFDLAKAQLEWKQAEKQIASLNGPQMTRFVGLAHSVDSTIDEVRELSKQMNLSGIPALNSVELAAYIKANGNSANGQLATRYMTAVNTLKEEFANLANGGYAPTEPAWKLADQQINGNYGVNQLGASLDEVQRLIRYRVNAIPGLSTMGPGTANRYTGQSAQEPNATVAPGSGMPQRPANVPPGSAYSPSRNQWRTPDGAIFNADGNRP